MERTFLFLAKRFVAGDTIDSAIAAVRQLNAGGMSASLDYLGEDVHERATADAIAAEYLRILDALRQTGVRCNVSLKLTAMGLLIDESIALENLLRIAQYARRNPDPFVRIDMEGSAVTDATLRVFEHAFATHRNIGIVLQAALKRTAGDVRRAIELGARVRLCKGAYKEPAAIAYQKSPEIRANFLALSRELLQHGNYPAIATHDRRILAAVQAFVLEESIAADRFEFQMLHGCRPALQRALVAKGYRMRIYVPFGTHWASYFYRRVAERPQNAIFALSSIFSR
jgi:proline dehydrogenase